MNNLTKFKTGRTVKVVVSEEDENCNNPNLDILTNALPSVCDNAVPGLYISNYCDCPFRFLYDSTNLTEIDDIKGYVDEYGELLEDEI